MEDLEAKNIFCAGTVRTNKLAAIPDLLDKATLKHMNRGNFMFRTKGSVTVTVWTDRKDIFQMSNAYPVTGDLKRKEDGVVEQVPCPPVLPGYKFMGRVDQNDQKKSYRTTPSAASLDAGGYASSGTSSM